MAVTNRQFYAVKNALTKEEKDVINFYELMWHLRHHVPTIEEVATQLKITQTKVNFYLTRKPVIKGLEQRGIPWRQHSQSELTATQVAAAVTMMNFTDTRSNDAKLDQLGIQPATYYAWLNDPQFKNLIDNLADQNLKNVRPTAIGEFTKLINKGDWQAIKYWLDVTGEMQQNDMPQSEVLIKMLIEIIQKHVKDPDVIVAIAQDIKLASANRTLEAVTPQAIEAHSINASVVEDYELADAKKMLNIG